MLYQKPRAVALSQPEAGAGSLDRPLEAADCGAQAAMLRRLAESARHPEIRGELLGIALGYERMAAFIERARNRLPKIV